MERETGVLVMEVYDNVKVGDMCERRFGPPKTDELTRLCQHYIRKGSTLYTDEERAYVFIAEQIGCNHDYVDHSSGQYVKSLVHTNTIDGWRGLLKTWWNAHRGVHDVHLFSTLKEFQWRANLRGDDPWCSLMSYIKAGHFPC